MDHSFAERPTLQCPQCGQSFSPEVWLIIDAAARPDLLDRVLDDTIHDVACPSDHVGSVDAPLVIYRPGQTLPILFSPAQQTTAEQDRELAGGLLGRLHASLGSNWRDEWLADGLTAVPRQHLVSALGGEPATDAQPEVASVLEEIVATLAAEGVDLESPEDLERALEARPELRAKLLAAAQGEQAGQAAEAADPLMSTLQAFIEANTWVESYRYLTAHPELLTDEADALLGRLLEGARAAGNDNATRVFSEHLELLRRSRAEGALAVFAAKIGATPEQFAQAIDAARTEEQLPAGARQAIDDVIAALAADGVSVNSAEELQAALAARPELQQRLAAALGGGGPDVPEQFRADIERANMAEQRYQTIGDGAALDEAAAAWERVLNHAEFGAADERFQLVTLNNAGGVFLRRYWSIGRLPDLDRALALWEEALRRTPADSPDRAGFLNNLGTGLHDRYARTGQPADLDAAIAAYEDAVGRTPADSPDRASRLNNLGNGLRDRYARTGRPADLDAAIADWKDAVGRTPADSPDRAGFLNNLGNGLRDRYARTGRPADLDDAIAAYEDAVGRTPADSPDRASRLNNLGNGLSNRYARTGRPADLDDAIAAYEDAVGRTPAAAPNRAGYLNNLGLGLRDRYARTGRPTDLDDAIAAYEDAVGRTPADSPDRASILNSLGNGLSDRYARTGRPTDLDAALSNARDACRLAQDMAGEVALGSARGWAGLALRRGLWDEVVEAADRGRDTLLRLTEVTVLATEQQSWRREVQGLAANSAYARARLGDPEAAVVELETGQATGLSATLGRGRDRARLEKLQTEDPELFDTYDRAAAERRVAEQSGEAVRGPDGASAVTAADRRQRATEAQAALDEVIARIRARPGYGDLFAPLTFADITPAVAPDQPLAYLATTPAGSVILLLRQENDTVVAEALWAGLTGDELERLLVRREIEQGNVGEVEGGLLLAQVGGINLSAELAAALPLLGERLMAPLADRLRELNATRVTLIPGGQLNLLPLHAASYHVDGQPRAFLDELAVSFAPSAEALATSRQRASGRDGRTGSALVIGNPMPVNSPLEWAALEARVVAARYPGRPQPLIEKEATRDKVAEAMPGRDLLHFACHGSFNTRDPLQSSLYFAHEKQLTLADIRDKDLSATRLAVLSACQTGLTDFRELPDEVIGLPAGFLQAGVPGVISSLWPVDDASTMLLMDRLYYYWLVERLEPDEALRAAQRWLRDRSRDELSAYYAAHARMTTEAAELGHVELPSSKDMPNVYADPYRWAAFTMTGA